MKIAAPYSANEKYSDIPDEYNLPWGETSSEKKLLEFCEIISDKRINIYTEKDIEIDLNIIFNAIVEAKKLNPNIYFRLNIYQMSLIELLKQKKINFYFDTSYVCSNFVLFAAMIAMGVSDIYAYDDLFYNLKKVSKTCKEHNIQIRTVLNRVASTSPGKGFDIRGPFITPRDMNVLEEYIDVAEFDCGDSYYNWNKFNALYKTFFIKKEWFGELKELNEDIIFFYPVYSSLPANFSWKANCRRRCAIGDDCNHCRLAKEIATELYEQNVSLKPVKTKEKDEENGQE